MKASQAAVTAAQEALGCDERENVKTGEHYCGKHRHLWLDKGCQDAVIAANAVIGADAPAIAAGALREAIAEVQWVYDLQCPPRRSDFAKGKWAKGAFCAHRWWSTVLGGRLDALRARADRLEAGQ